VEIAESFNIPEQLIQAQLERILSSPLFINSERLRRFLSYAVQRAAQGQVDQLKEYTLGLSVFDKRDSFDPRFDPIVRVEAGRLRTRLKQYYDTEGSGDPLVIDLPRGSYVPRFEPASNARPALAAFVPAADKREPTRSAIAVLPFSDHSPNRDQEYFCDGITEELINALTKIPGLRVVAWQSARRLRGKTLDIPKIAEQLKAGAVLGGSVRKAGERIRVTVQLIRTSDGSYLWSEIYERELKDIFSIQGEISQAVVEKLKIQLADGQSKHLIHRYTENLDAYNLYLKGRYYWNQRSEASLKKGIEYFEQAIAQDTRYAPAYSGLADSYSLLGNYGALPAKNVKAKAMEAALKAVEIDPTLAEAHTALGHVRATYAWDWSGACAEYEHAMTLNPDYATVHHWYAITYLSPHGWLDAALTEIHKAEELNPVSVSIKRDIAIILYNARRYERAIEQCNRTIGVDPAFDGAYWAKGLALEALSRYGEAVSTLEKGLELSPDSPRLLGAIGHAYGIWGRKENASSVLNRLRELAERRYVSPFDFALVYAGLRDHDACFLWLRTAYESRSYELVSMKVDPRFDDIRADSRYTDLLRELRLDTGLR
jgi:serine/threonine-protein kinase